MSSMLVNGLQDRGVNSSCITTIVYLRLCVKCQQVCPQGRRSLDELSGEFIGVGTREIAVRATVIACSAKPRFREFAK